MKKKVFGFLVALSLLIPTFLPATPEGLQQCYDLCAYSCIDLAGTPNHGLCEGECSFCCSFGPCIYDPHWY